MKEPVLKLLGRNLRRLRKEADLTQEELGDVSGLNHKYIGEVERGKKNPSVTTLLKLSRALGVPTCEILSFRCHSCSEQERKDKRRRFVSVRNTAKKRGNPDILIKT